MWYLQREEKRKAEQWLDHLFSNNKSSWQDFFILKNSPTEMIPLRVRHPQDIHKKNDDYQWDKYSSMRQISQKLHITLR